MKPLKTQHWQTESEGMLEAIAQWRMSHPQATIAEIEQAIDDHLHRFRAHLIEGTAQTSEAAQASSLPRCEQCGRVLQARGKSKRTLRTHGDQSVELERTYLSCPHCGGGFFPPG